MRLTEHFTVEDLCWSHTAVRLGIFNQVPSALYPNLLRLAEGLERVRAVLGGPVLVNSGYRSPALNKAMGGAKNSQHMGGLAADIVGVHCSPRDLAKIVVDNKGSVNFDQLILEHPDTAMGGWVHISFDVAPRGEVLTGRGHPVTYIQGLC